MQFLCLYNIHFVDNILTIPLFWSLCLYFEKIIIIYAAIDIIMQILPMYLFIYLGLDFEFMHQWLLIFLW